MEKRIFSDNCRRGRPYIRLLLFVFLFQCLVLSALAQSFRVSGTVKDQQGKNLSGVSIVIKGTTNGTTSDADGKFSIEVPGQRSVLVFSMVDHGDKEETVGSRIVINVTLTESASNLE